MHNANCIFVVGTLFMKAMAAVIVIMRAAVVTLMMAAGDGNQTYDCGGNRNYDGHQK